MVMKQSGNFLGDKATLGLAGCFAGMLTSEVVWAQSLEVLP